MRRSGSGVRRIEEEAVAVGAAKELASRQQQKKGLPGPTARRKRRLHIKLRQGCRRAVRIVFEENGIQRKIIPGIGSSGASEDYHFPTRQ